MVAALPVARLGWQSTRDRPPGQSSSTRASRECRLPAQLAGTELVHHGRTGQQPNSGSGRDFAFVSGGEVGLFSGVVTSWLFAVMMVVVEVGWAGLGRLLLPLSSNFEQLL